MERSHTLLDFLPYKGDIILNDVDEKIRVLKLCRFFLNALNQTISALYLKKYELFDAQVSENLCQIRALYLSFFITHQLQKINQAHLHNKSHKIKKTLEIITSLINEYSQYSRNKSNKDNKSFNKKINIIKFININMDIEINRFFFILTQLYILSKYKLTGKYNISYGINYQKLSFNIQIESRTFLTKIVNKFQRTISRYSCFFLINIIRTDQEYFKIVRQLQLQDEVGRYVLPCYEVTKIFLEEIKREKIILHINITLENDAKEKTVDLMYSYINKKIGFSIVNEKALIEKKPIITIQGYSHLLSELTEESKNSFISRFISFDLEDIILSNVAQHPQYSGKKLLKFKTNPYQPILNKIDDQNIKDRLIDMESKFLTHQALSKKIGCSQDNPFLFLITHIYFSSYQMTEIFKETHYTEVTHL